MANIQRYIKWKRVKVNDNFYKDVNTNGAFEQATTNSTFTETGYEINGFFLGIVEYPNDTTQETIDALITQYSEFQFTFIDEATANTLLSELGDVTVNNFVFTDNRPIPDFI